MENDQLGQVEGNRLYKMLMINAISIFFVVLHKFRRQEKKLNLLN